MAAFFTLITLPVMLLNFFSGIVGGIWLAILGEWRLLFVGLGAIVTGAFAISLALMPSLIFAIPLQSAVERRSVSGVLFFLSLNLLWTYLLIAVWCVGAFYLIGQNYILSPALPYLLWAYSIAVGPWTFLAKKDAQAGNTHAAFPTFFACVGCAAMMLITLSSFSFPTIQTLAIAFCTFLGISFVLQVAEMVMLIRSERN
jgi:hypothetical protein